MFKSVEKKTKKFQAEKILHTVIKVKKTFFCHCFVGKLFRGVFLQLFPLFRNKSISSQVRLIEWEALQDGVVFIWTGSPGYSLSTIASPSPFSAKIHQASHGIALINPFFVLVPNFDYDCHQYATSVLLPYHLFLEAIVFKFLLKLWQVIWCKIYCILYHHRLSCPVRPVQGLYRSHEFFSKKLKFTKNKSPPAFTFDYFSCKSALWCSAVFSNIRILLLELTCTNTWFLPAASWPLNRPVIFFLQLFFFNEKAKNRKVKKCQKLYRHYSVKKGLRHSRPRQECH